MARFFYAVPTVLLLVGCTTGVSGNFQASRSTAPTPSAEAVSPVAVESPAPSRSPRPVPSPPLTRGPYYAVLVDLLSDPSQYSVSFVNVDGAVVNSVTAAQRTPIATAAGHAVVLPYVSASLTALYFLDGDATVKRIGLDGTTGIAARLRVSPGMEAAFAVSPDDSQMAVTVLDFDKNAVHVTLYTQTFNGDSAPHVIFQSDSDYVWPIAWRAGLLVLAHAYGPFEEDIAKTAPGRDNPYSAISYHVVDALTATRVALIGSCTVSGALSPAGSGCIQGGAIDWQGNTAPWSTNDWGSVSSAAALSPDGQWMAAAAPDNPGEMAIWRPNGEIANYVSGPGKLDWAGWIDAKDIITGSYTDPVWQPQVTNVIDGGKVHTVPAHGFFAGVLPTIIV